MRKIENEMVNAFNNNAYFKKSNTRVEIISGVTRVFLHDNLICTKGLDGIKIYNGGWYSNTTKSRLHALLQGLNFGVCQRRHEWFLIKNLCSGTREYVPFASGMTVQ